MITQRQLEIYDNLLNYTKTGEVFYIADQTFKGRKYRIFSYRLGAYTPFMQPDALEGRGIMFEMDENDQPVRLAARTMHKFFNLNENPSTMNLNIAQNNIEIIMDKVDGSLISTYLDHEGELQLKSKTSLGSDQVQMAWKVLNADPALKEILTEIAQHGYATVNMEYLGPDNRIVIGYETPQLRILNTRAIESGEYELSMHYWDQHPLFSWAAGSMPVGFDLKTLDDATGIEGVVVVLASGEWFKHKTPWYAALHKTKDSINSKKKLFECVVTEASDDLKAMFFDDLVAMKLINEMEALVIPKFDHAVALVEKYYEENKALDRKSYAIKGQQELQRELFSLAMTKYLGREVDYKEWAVKHFEWFGVRDEVINTEE
jgi:RNA ligase